jgi:uncharacterized membrane protein YgdD (TMEM256/DUF423 family)
MRLNPTRIAALAGLLAVILGAFGAHALRDHLARLGTTSVWEKAVFYHFIHVVMLFLLAERPQLPRVAWWSFLGGIVFFSGSLYLLAVTDILWLGAITPVGGVLFLVGWTCLILCGSRSGDRDGGRGGGRGHDDGRGPVHGL